MDLSRQINRLLEQVDATAAALTTAEHPDVIVSLAVPGQGVEHTQIVDCTVDVAYTTPGGELDVTLRPARGYCLDCGAEFDLAPQSHDLRCPACTAQAARPDSRMPGPAPAAPDG